MDHAVESLTNGVSPPQHIQVVDHAVPQYKRTLLCDCVTHVVQRQSLGVVAGVWGVVRNEVLGILLRALSLNRLRGIALDLDSSKWQIRAKESQQMGVTERGREVMCGGRCWARW